MTITHPHEIEERDFAQGSRLWDGGEGVCCAAFQLGACAHTEGYDQTDDLETTYEVPLVDPDAVDDEPF